MPLPQIPSKVQQVLEKLVCHTLFGSSEHQVMIRRMAYIRQRGSKEFFYLLLDFADRSLKNYFRNRRSKILKKLQLTFVQFVKSRLEAHIFESPALKNLYAWVLLSLSLISLYFGEEKAFYYLECWENLVKSNWKQYTKSCKIFGPLQSIIYLFAIDRPYGYLDHFNRYLESCLKVDSVVGQEFHLDRLKSLSEELPDGERKR